MKSLILLIMTIGFLACSSRQESSTFKSIDCSFYDGFFESIKVFENGKTFIWYNFNFQDINEYYSLTIDKVILDSLNKMANILYNTKLDSIYLADICDRCRSFSLIINFEEKTVFSSYKGDLNEEKLKPLFQMVKYLDNLCGNSRNNVDSIFSFESKDRIILPPPPPEKPN
jgi:hypothetical protein